MFGCLVYGNVPDAWSFYCAKTSLSGFVASGTLVGLVGLGLSVIQLVPFVFVFLFVSYFI